MPETPINDRNVLIPLNKLLEANDRLVAALNATANQWPYVTNCWIDQLSEPTPLLADHRLHNGERRNS